MLCGVFITVGLSIFIPTCLLPLLRFNAMRTWTETPCTIIRNQDTGRSDAVAYEYTIDFVRYESKDVGLEGMFLPMRSTWELKPDLKTVCYVNPSDRREAVLWRDIDPSILVGLAPLLFVVFPGLALVAGWRNIGRPVPPTPPPVPEGPVAPSILLEPAMRSRGCGILMTLFFLVVLGGIVAVLWIFGTIGHRVLAVPFSLLWLFLLRVLGRMLLSLLNPRVALRVTPGRGVTGGPLDVRWDMTGGLRGVRRFLLELVVREEHVYRSGKSTRSRTSPLATVEIAKGGAKELRRGSTRVTLPDTMHSFRHGGTAVVWLFRLTAEIPFAPDIDEEYPLEVGPACR